MRVYLSVLKQLRVDAEGTLRMVWWAANEKLKLHTLGGALKSTDSTLWLNVDSGAIVEGNVTWGGGGSDSGGDITGGGLCFTYGGSRPGTAFTAAFVRFNSTHVLTGESTTPDCAAGTPAMLRVNDSLGVTAGAAEPTRGLPLAPGDNVMFRLMFRRGMYDLYLNNALILSYALAVARAPPPAALQQVQLVGSWADATGLESWRMNLPSALALDSTI